MCRSGLDRTWTRFAAENCHTRTQVHPVDLVVCLLIVLAALAAVARRLNVSYLIVLVIGGLVLALIPRLPEVPPQPGF